MPERPHRRSLLARRLPLPWLIAWRYMRGERSQILNSTALAAFVATALGVMAMVVAMALMTGYTEDLQRKLIGLQGEAIASPLVADGFARDRALLEQVRQIPGVVRMGPVSYGEGSLAGADGGEAVNVVLRGVDPADDPTVIRFAAPTAAEQVHPLAGTGDKLPGVLLGKELQRQLAVETGDVLRLTVLQLGDRRPRFRYRSVRCAGTFATGFSEFDSRWVVLDRQLLLELRGPTGLDVMELKLADPDASEQVVERVAAVLGPDWLVQEWKKLNKQLFAALALQQTLLFLVLGLIVVVSTFNVASALLILVRERMRDVGVLGALGLAPRQLWWIFACYGLALGAIGTLGGVLAGAGTAWVITEFELVRFDPEVAAIYFIDSVPFRVELGDVTAIVGFSLAVTFLACAWPARRAARIQPSLALRDE